MKELVYRKKIIIPYCGYINLLKLRGPVDKPYMETVENINKLIMVPYPVYEVLNDGSYVELNIQNFNKENGPENDPAMVASMENVFVSKKYSDSSFVQSIGDEDTLKAKQIKMLKASTEKLSPKISGDIETVESATVTKLDNDNNKYQNKKKKYQVDSVEKK